MMELQTILVDGRSYQVIECAGYLKAAMNGYFSWTSVWADSYPNLKLRIRLALRGRQ